MARVLTGGGRRAGEGGELVVWVGAAEAAAHPDRAEVRVSARSPLRARRLTFAVAGALRALAKHEAPALPVLRVPSRKALARLGDRVAGALAVVPVSARNLRFAGEIVEALRAAGAAGVQVAWDGEEPPRERAEAPIFALLERARSTPGKAPVVLSRDEEPAESLKILAGARRSAK
jgi:hypothetical protein